MSPTNRQSLPASPASGWAGVLGRSFSAEREHASNPVPSRIADESHMFDDSCDGFAILDDQWRVLQMNAAGLSMGRRTAAQVIGRNHWAVWPETLGTEVEHLYRRVMRTGEPESIKQTVGLAGGPPQVFEISAQKTPGWMLAVFFRDVTALEHAAGLSRRRAASTEAALGLTGLGTLSWGRRDDRIECSQRTRDIFGFAAGQGCTWADFEQRILPEDRGRARLAFESRGHFRVQFRIDRGGVRHLVCLGAEQDDGAGGALLAGVFEDVTERESQAQDLRDAAERKDEFLALLSHELRNPLAPIVTAASILSRTAPDPATAQKMGRLIQRQAGHMATLLADVLDVCRINKGLFTLARRTIDFGDVVATAVEQTSPLMEQRSQVFVLDAPSAPLAVVGDEGRLVQVFANILNNAAKYTPGGGEITMAVEARGDHVVTCIRDSGQGIGADLLPRVFDLFTQAERSTDRAGGGLGLGLALVKNLVELHGGQVTAHSEGLGRGSQVVVTLPLARLLPERERRGAGPREPARLEPARIVVVNDHADAALSLATLLEQQGHTAIVADGAPEVLRHAEAALADIYILDIGMQGLELARAIRARARAGAVPPVLIAVTGDATARARESSLAAGIDHHFERPLDPSRLLDVVARSRRASPAAQPAA